MFSPQFQDGSGVHGRVDPADKVEVSDVEAAVDAHGQSHRCQQLVPVREAVTAGAGNTAPAAVSHDAGDNRGLLRHKDVLAAALVQDTWTRDETQGTSLTMELVDGFKPSYLLVSLLKHDSDSSTYH